MENALNNFKHPRRRRSSILSAYGEDAQYNREGAKKRLFSLSPLTVIRICSKTKIDIFWSPLSALSVGAQDF